MRAEMCQELMTMMFRVAEGQIVGSGSGPAHAPPGKPTGSIQHRQRGRGYLLFFCVAISYICVRVSNGKSALIKVNILYFKHIC